MAEGDVVLINHDLCFMSGECVLAAPEVYAFNEDGYPLVIEGGVESAPTELLIQTMETCPSGAIAIEKRRE